MTTKTRSRIIALALTLASAAVSTVNAASVYDQTILSDRPVMFLATDNPSAGSQTDLSGHGNTGTYMGGTPGVTALPNGEKAAVFNGSSQYLSVKAVAALSVPTTKSLTIESWIKPSTLQFPHSEAENYVYFLGKGNPSDGYEYANRMYSLSNSVNRPNRISVYAWNTSGGLGSGGYFQDTVTTSQWIHVTDVIDMNTGYISIYKNGVLRSKVPLSQYNVTPGTTRAPFNIGTRNYNSWFQGAIGKVAVYNYVLSASRIAAHYSAMSAAVATTPTATAPVISGIAVANLTSTGATINWTTDKVSNSQVEYGLSTSYGTQTPATTATGLSHGVALANLKAGTVYHFRVKSKDPTTGLTGISADKTFTTPAGTTASAPLASAVQATNLTQTGVTITWTTDKISHSQVEYGASTSYGLLSPQSTATGVYHSITLSNLKAGTVYHYRVKSLDDTTKLTGVSGDYTFTTPGATTTSNVISSVQAAPTSSGATITWNTTAVSHSQVEYGLTSSYGTLSYLSTATGTSHNLALSGLKSGTVYYYRVKSLDDKTGQTAVSGGFSFKTSGTTTAAK